MPSIRPEDLTPFSRAALKLDQEFAELARVSEQMEGVDLETDGGLDEGVKMLNRAANCGQAIADTMQEFSRSLQEARDKAEAATKVVAERGQRIQQRRQHQELLQEKLTQVKEILKTAGAGLAGVGGAERGELTDEDRRQIASELQRLQEPMTRLVEAAQAIKTEAARSNFKRVERQADSVIDSLQASLKKIAQAIGPK